MERNVIDQPIISDYKGKPVLNLPLGGGYGFGFGLTKATAILENLTAIQSFVESQGKEIKLEESVI